jgi:hypothetical protein
MACLTKLTWAVAGEASTKPKVWRIQQFLPELALDLDKIARVFVEFLPYFSL